MKFRSKINDLEYNINFRESNIYTNEIYYFSFRIKILYRFGGRGVDGAKADSLNIYPTYNKETFVINWNTFDDLELPSDLKSYCDRLIKNIALL